MGVKIDNPWRDVLAGCVDNFGAILNGDIAADGDDLAGADADVGAIARRLQTVEDRAALDH